MPAAREAVANIRFGNSENCIYWAADHALGVEKKWGYVFHSEACDQYATGEERVFESSTGLFGGAVFYSASAYESSWFLSGMAGFRKKEMETYGGSTGEVMMYRGEAVGGYQYHFDWGLLLTAGYALAYESAAEREIAIKSGEEAANAKELKKLAREVFWDSRAIMLFGWRF